MTSRPTRAYDSLYDKDYSVSGARDFYRDQARAGGFTLERVPQYGNLFSEIPTYPSQTVRFRNVDKVSTHFISLCLSLNSPRPLRASSKALRSREGETKEANAPHSFLRQQRERPIRHVPDPFFTDLSRLFPSLFCDSAAALSFLAANERVGAEDGEPRVPG